MVEHTCSSEHKHKTESEKDMKHFTLNNKTIIRSEKQAAAEFIKIHAKNDKIKEDLSTLKSLSLIHI